MNGRLTPGDSAHNTILTATIKHTENTDRLRLRFGHPSESPPSFSAPHQIRHSLANTIRVPSNHTTEFDGTAHTNLSIVDDSTLTLAVDYLFTSYESFGAVLTLTSDAHDPFADLLLTNTQTHDLCAFLKYNNHDVSSQQNPLVFLDGTTYDLNTADLPLKPSD